MPSLLVKNPTAILLPRNPAGKSKVTFGGERITLTKHGKDAVAIVPLDDLNLLEAIETQIDIKEALEALKEPGSISWEQVKKELDL